MRRSRNWLTSAPASRAIDMLVSRNPSMGRLRFLGQVLDVVFEDEQIGSVAAGDADKPAVVILDDPRHLGVIAEADANPRLQLDQALQILYFLEGLFGGALLSLRWWCAHGKESP